MSWVPIIEDKISNKFNNNFSIILTTMLVIISGPLGTNKTKLET